ncbi:response regulator [Methanofollis fontis]|uniref:response regulator n=1 Tax=Methanofollis fontis TaxID=2052832 RepID=UPI0013EEE4C2|nr:response regulator [Methanofollis fontis]
MAGERILVVEDEAIVAMELEAVLRGCGYEVMGPVGRGNDAVRIVHDSWPDLILMDIRLKGPMDGTEAARRILAIHDIPILFLSAFSDEVTLERATDTHSYGYLTKPFNERVLCANIALALRRHRMRMKREIGVRILRSAMSLMPDAVIAADGSGQIVAVNEAMTEMTGWRHADLAGQSLAAIIPEHASGNATVSLLTSDRCEIPVGLKAAPTMDDGLTDEDVHLIVIRAVRPMHPS